jgi:hypothetical protein
MTLPNDIIFEIVKQIYNPKVFFNFALGCKQFARECRRFIIENEGIPVRFLKLIRTFAKNVSLYHHILPNGKKNGISHYNGICGHEYWRHSYGKLDYHYKIIKDHLIISKLKIFPFLDNNDKPEWLHITLFKDGNQIYKNEIDSKYMNDFNIRIVVYKNRDIHDARITFKDDHSITISRNGGLVETKFNEHRDCDLYFPTRSGEKLDIIECSKVRKCKCRTYYIR